MELTNDSMLKINKRIQNAYLLLTVLSLICSLKVVFGTVRHLGELITTIATSLMFFVIYAGLKHKKDWTIPLVLFVSALSIIQEFYWLLLPAEDMMMVFRKPLSALLIFFFAYQIAFFSKSDVRVLYGVKQKIVF